ncbi:histidine triad (HIT) protein [candidate division TM7 genomosp. GTL1]|nr:histidine triad (HIT) protein [candidate division TM7 genomosp. GTL1]
MEESIFTKIVKGDIPSYEIYEDDDIFAFLDIYPAQPGHTLVVTKQQLDRFEELPDELYQKLMAVVKKLAKHLHQMLKVERITMKVEGFDVHHVHIHLIPCNEARDFWVQPNRFVEPDHEALKAMAERLRLV